MILRCPIISCTTSKKNSANYNYVIQFKMHPDFKDVKVKNKKYALPPIKYDKTL